MIDQKRDPDLAGTMAAMLRAAQRAREEARRAGTPIAIWEDGKMKLISPDQDVPGLPKPK